MDQTKYKTLNDDDFRAKYVRNIPLVLVEINLYEIPSPLDVELDAYKLHLV